MLSDGQIKRLAVQLDLLQLADSRHGSAEKFRAFARACYAEGQRDAQVRIAELELDAARYRWLRLHGGDSQVTGKDGYGGYELLYGVTLDEAVDAAMRKDGGEVD